MLVDTHVATVRLLKGGVGATQCLQQRNMPSTAECKVLTLKNSSFMYSTIVELRVTRNTVVMMSMAEYPLSNSFCTVKQKRVKQLLRS